MLSTTDAFRYAFCEILKRPVFWILIALLYVLLDSIRINFHNDGFQSNIILIAENLLYVIVVSVTIKAIANREYHLTDTFREPIILVKACILAIIIFLLYWTLLMLPMMFFLTAFFFKNSLAFEFGLPIITVMILLLVYIFTRLFFAQYYFFDKKNSLWQCLKESWKDSDYQVSLSILMSILWMGILCIPLFLLDKVMSDFCLHSSLFITPIGQLAGAHMYMQLQYKKDKNMIE